MTENNEMPEVLYAGLGTEDNVYNFYWTASEEMGKLFNCIRYIRADTVETTTEIFQALVELTEVATRCDSWESFPSEPLDRAYAIIRKNRELL